MTPSERSRNDLIMRSTGLLIACHTRGGATKRPTKLARSGFIQGRLIERSHGTRSIVGTVRGERQLECKSRAGERTRRLLVRAAGCSVSPLNSDARGPRVGQRASDRAGTSTTTSPHAHIKWQGLRLTSADRKYMVQFIRDGAIFSRLRPYESWDVFSEEGRRLWKIFVELSEPSEIQRLGVRFINRIAPIELTKVVNNWAKPPRFLEPLGLPMSGFLFQSTHDVPGHPFKINVVQTIQPPGPLQSDGFALIFDIDACQASHRQKRPGPGSRGKNHVRCSRN